MDNFRMFKYALPVFETCIGNGKLFGTLEKR
jgi:hypothetical protein